MGPDHGFDVYASCTRKLSKRFPALRLRLLGEKERRSLNLVGRRFRADVVVRTVREINPEKVARVRRVKGYKLPPHLLNRRSRPAQYIPCGRL